jgi:hypothetical protein
VFERGVQPGIFCLRHTFLAETVLNSDRWHERLTSSGARFLRDVGALVEGADPSQTVSPASRLLCAGLAELGVSTYRGFGGSAVAQEVGRAAALLSLLTKIDDQVIDSRPFHGGPETDRDELRVRTQAYLEPTLRSILDAEPATPEPRCRLAARLGLELRTLSSRPERLERLLALIERGWAIQVDAVAVLSAHPSTVTESTVLEVTANISGAWLMMIAMVGTLPADAGRMLNADEEASFFEWGLHIQRADALADLEKDLEQGLISSFPAHRLWQLSPRDHRDAVRCDSERVFAHLAELDIDLAAMSTADNVARLRRDLAALGDLPSLLDWILGFLTWRYLAASRCVRKGDDPALAVSSFSAASWANYVRAVTPQGPDSSLLGAPCSEL